MNCQGNQFFSVMNSVEKYSVLQKLSQSLTYSQKRKKRKEKEKEENN